MTERRLTENGDEYVVPDPADFPDADNDDELEVTDDGAPA